MGDHEAPEESFGSKLRRFFGADPESVTIGDEDDYAIAVPETARPSMDHPDGDPGHLIPDEVWGRVVAHVEGAS